MSLPLKTAFSFVALTAIATASTSEAAPTGARVAQATRPAAASTAAPAAAPRRGIGDFGGANNNKPINIEADKLEVFQKEGRAVYSGNIVAVQGETTMKCSQLIVYFDQSRAGAAAQNSSAASGGSSNDAVKKLECKGPVSVVAKSEDKSQVATGDNAIYDRAGGVVTLSGNVTLADGKSISRCQTFLYNTNSGKADCTALPGGRVQGVFETGDQKPGAAPSASASARPKPAPKPTN